MRHFLTFTLLFISVFFNTSILSGQYSIEEIPDPKVKGQNYFVSDPKGILPIQTTTRLNAISTRIESVSSAEYAIVIVNDYTGESDFEFALDLYNTWQLGKSGADNGLLLFIATERQEYRFISGRGMEGVFPDVYLHRVGEKFIIPEFQKDNYSKGLIEASEFIARVLTAPDAIEELQNLMPEVLPYWRLNNPPVFNSLLLVFIGFSILVLLQFKARNLLPDVTYDIKPGVAAPFFYGVFITLGILFLIVFVQVIVYAGDLPFFDSHNLHYIVFMTIASILTVKVYQDISYLKEGFKDSEASYEGIKSYLNYAIFPILLLPTLWLVAPGILKYFRKNEGRFDPPDNSGNWIRILQNHNFKRAKLLDKGEKLEENIKSQIYEIWQNTVTGEVHKTSWDQDYRHYTCPNCSYRTVIKQKSKTVIPATSTKKGERLFYDECRYCKQVFNKKTKSIPKKTNYSSSSSSSRSSSSSGSGWGSSSGSSSSSGRGSWGGGSSGGGGAGGRW